MKYCESTRETTDFPTPPFSPPMKWTRVICLLSLSRARESYERNTPLAHSDSDGNRRRLTRRIAEQIAFVLGASINRRPGRANLSGQDLKNHIDATRRWRLTRGRQPMPGRRRRDRSLQIPAATG